MRYLLLGISLSTLSATTAMAAKAPQIESLPNHRFSGNVELRVKSDSNVGAAPGSQGVRFMSDETEDDTDTDDFGDEMLDELVDDTDLNFEDLEEQDDAGDEDADGTDDAVDANSGPASRRDSDNAANAKLNLGHSYKVDAGLRWKSNLLVNGSRQEERNDLERFNWAFNTGPVITLNKAWSLNPSLTYAETSQDGNRKVDSWIASLGAAWKASKEWKWQARYNYQQRDIVDARGADADVNGLRVGGQYKPTKKDTFLADFSPNIEDNTRASQDKDRYGFRLGYQRQLPWKLSFSTTAARTYTDYTNLGREDVQDQYAAGIQKKFSHGLYTGLAIDYAERDSNIAGKDFDNTSVLLTSGWKF